MTKTMKIVTGLIATAVVVTVGIVFLRLYAKLEFLEQRQNALEKNHKKSIDERNSKIDALKRQLKRLDGQHRDDIDALIGEYIGRNNTLSNTVSDHVHDQLQPHYVKLRERLSLKNIQKSIALALLAQIVNEEASFGCKSEFIWQDITIKFQAPLQERRMVCRYFQDVKRHAELTALIQQDVDRMLQRLESQMSVFQPKHE